MAIKYRKEDRVRDAVAARITPYRGLERKVRVTQRGRLIMIYAGILFVCAFLLVGELFMRRHQLEQGPRTVRGVITALQPGSEGEGVSATIDFEAAPSGMEQVRMALTAEHAANLKPGDTVAVVLEPGQERGAWIAVDMSRFALIPATP